MVAGLPMNSTACCPRCGCRRMPTPVGLLCPVCLAKDGFGPLLQPDDPELARELERDDWEDDEEAWTLDAKAAADPGASLEEAVSRFAHFELIREIARGGMGIVYEAYDLKLRRTVALKLLLHGGFSSPDYVARFQQEARAAAALEHPNIVRIHEIGVFHGQHFFTMEFIPGRNLAELVWDRPVDSRQAAQLMHRIAVAVHHAHERGVLHRDLKPSNVLLNAFGQPCITDFGLAKRLDTKSDLTATGEMLGSPSFAAPEQLSGDRGLLGVRSDVYSLGAILYHLLTSRAPFVGDSVAATVYLVQHQVPVSPREFNPLIAPDLETICLKCLRKQPSQRYDTASSLAADLERFLNGEPIRARPVTALEHWQRRVRRHPMVAGLSGVVVLLLVGIAVLLFSYARHEQQARHREAKRRESAELARYAADMGLAQRVFQEGQTGRARELLDGLIPDSESRDLRGFEWYWLRQSMESQELDRIWDGPRAVLGMDQSADGERVAIAFATELFWGTHRGDSAPQSVPLPKVLGPRQVQILPGEESLVVADSMGLHWVRRDSARVRTFSNRPVACLAVGAGPDLVVVGFSGDELGAPTSKTEVWDLSTQTRVARRMGEQDLALFLAKDSDRVYSMTAQGSVLEWDLVSGEVQTLLAGHGRVEAACFSANGRWLAFADRGGRIRFLHTPTREISGEIRVPSTPEIKLALNASGTHLGWVGSSDQRVYLCRVPGGSAAAAWVGHGEAVNGIRGRHDQEGFLTYSQDGTVRTWGLSEVSMERRFSISGRSQPGWRPVFSKDGNRMAYTGGGTSEETLSGVVDLRIAQETPKPGRPGHPIAGDLPISMEFSGIPIAWFGAADGAADPEAIALLSPGKSVHVRSTSPPAGERSTKVHVPHSLGSQGGVVSDDGQWVAWIQEPGQAQALHLKSGQHVEGPAVDTRLLAFLDTTTSLVLVGPQNVIRWSPVSHVKQPLAVPDFESTALAVKSERVALGDGSGRLHLLDSTTGEWIQNFRAHAGAVRAVIFGGHDGSLVSAGEDRTVRFWNLANGRELAVFTRPEAVQSLTFSPDARWLVLGEPKAWVLWGIQAQKRGVFRD